MRIHNNHSPTTRPARLDGAPLDYAPANEAGVVFLFAHLAKRHFGLRVEQVRANFPDCTAYLGEKRIRIEFEHRSKNFAAHRHDPRQCDWLVCWIHDWPACPRRLRVVELRRFFGLGFNVWIVPAKWEYRERIGRLNTAYWSVPSQASPGDLIVFYRARPDGFIKDIFRIASPITFVKKARFKRGRGFKTASDWFATVRRVATLKSPVHWKELQTHPILRTAAFVRRTMQGRNCVTPYWPQLFGLMLERNRGLRTALAPFGPHRLA
ncbi:MAG: hypothetical protein HY527_01100 [Betaproteobacteria bacterium]|nr:hypothetical protein [Betaproteobacteria bacterium]